MTTDRTAMIRERIERAIQAETIEITDDSAQHVGHEGAKAGGGHFSVRVVSNAFDGKSMIERHRIIYDAMGDAMKAEIHALSIKAVTPDEAR